MRQLNLYNVRFLLNSNELVQQLGPAGAEMWRRVQCFEGSLQIKTPVALEVLGWTSESTEIAGIFRFILCSIYYEISISVSIYEQNNYPIKFAPAFRDSLNHEIRELTRSVSQQIGSLAAPPLEKTGGKRTIFPPTFAINSRLLHVT